MCGLPRASCRQIVPGDKEVSRGSRGGHPGEGKEWRRAGAAHQLSCCLERVLTGHRLLAHALLVSKVTHSTVRSIGNISWPIVNWFNEI